MKKNLIPRNNKGQQHGLWVRYNYDNNSKLWFKGQYINGVEHGYWIHDWNNLVKSKIRFHLT